MRIAYIGNYRHPFCTEVHISAELEGMGHDVNRLQEPPGGVGAVDFVHRVRQDLLADPVDLVLFTRTWGLPEATTHMWREFEVAGMVTASFHLDLYRGLAREGSIVDDPFWTTGWVFTADGDPGTQAWLDGLGVRHAWSPAAIYSGECGAGIYRAEFDYDVVFVGSKADNYHDEWPWRRELLEYLERTYGRRFRRFGGDMPGGPIRNAALNDLYASAKVVIGDSLALDGHRDYWSDRYYETVGRGGFLIGPRVPGIEAHFEDGVHLFLYDIGDLPGLHAQIDFALEKPAMRRAIAGAGMVHVAANHTYRNRLEVALATMGLT